MIVDVLWIVLAALAILAAMANVASLAQGFSLRGHVRRALRMSFGAYLPRAVVLLPVRGLDEGFDDNLRAILSQAYPAYRLMVLSDHSDDPAVSRIREISRGFPRVPVAYVLSDPEGMGGKVNALRTGLRHVASDDEVVVFADADIRPPPDWLRQLVQPLADVTLGASTGFRWYTPSRPTFWSLVRSEWNAVSANVLFDPARNYTWGGSSAVRTEHLAVLDLDTRWREVLSDDLVLTDAVRKAGLKIAFAPSALVATVDGGGRRACVEWCFRQMTMASLYQRGLRKYAAAAFAVFNGSVILGIPSIILAVLVSWTFVVPAGLFLITLPATVAKASLRRRALFSAAPSVASAWRVPAWRVTIASLAVPWIMAWGLLRTRRITTVVWRGRTYDVRDSHHVRLLASGDPRGPSD